MFEKEAEEYRKDLKSKFFLSEPQLDLACQGFKDGYSKCNERLIKANDSSYKDKPVVGFDEVMEQGRMTREEIKQKTSLCFLLNSNISEEEKICVIEKVMATKATIVSKAALCNIITYILKQNAELKSKNCWKTCKYAEPKSQWISHHIQDIERLTKAKEIIKRLKDIVCGRSGNDWELIEQAEQFISEVEKRNL